MLAPGSVRRERATAAAAESLSHQASCSTPGGGSSSEAPRLVVRLTGAAPQGTATQEPHSEEVVALDATQSLNSVPAEEQK